MDCRGGVSIGAIACYNVPQIPFWRNLSRKHSTCLPAMFIHLPYRPVHFYDIGVKEELKGIFHCGGK